MTGPGAQHSFFAKMVNLVIYAELINPTGIDQPFRNEAPLKLAAHLLADYVAKSLAGQEPEDWECYEWELGRRGSGEKGPAKSGIF